MMILPERERENTLLILPIRFRSHGIKKREKEQQPIHLRDFSAVMWSHPHGGSAERRDKNNYDRRAIKRRT